MWGGGYSGFSLTSLYSSQPMSFHTYCQNLKGSYSILKEWWIGGRSVIYFSKYPSLTSFENDWNKIIFCPGDYNCSSHFHNLLFFKSPKIRFIDRHHSNYYGRRAKAFRVKRRTDGFWETIRDGVPIIAGSPREIFDTLKSYEGVNWGLELFGFFLPYLIITIKRIINKTKPTAKIISCPV